MTENEIKVLIGNSPEATEVVADYAASFERELRVNACEGYDNINDLATLLVASFIANAIRWKNDRWGHVSHERLPGDEWFLPSQIRIKVVKELQYLSDFLSEPMDVRQTRRRNSISMYAVKALKKEAPLGPALLSHLQHADLDAQLSQHLDDLGLGGDGESRLDAGSVFGFSDPAMFTTDLKINVRLVKRMAARPEVAADTKLLRANLVNWELSPAVNDVLADAHRCHRGRHVSLFDLRRRLARLGDEEMKNLLFCGRQAARLLEIAFHMTDRKTSNQSNETIESWLHATPLARFIVGVFEMFTPTLGVPFNEVKLATNIQRTSTGMLDERNFDRLTKSAWDLVNNGYDCAQAILELIPALRGTDLDVGAGLMEISEKEQKRNKLDQKKNSRPQNQEDIESRLEYGRKLMIAHFWALRHDMLTLRGYTAFLGWYHWELRDHLPNPVWVDFQLQIFNEIEDWYRELRARYEEGIIYKHQEKRRAGGLPLDMPELPAIVKRHTIEVLEYPLNRGFGARHNDAIMQALLHSIVARQPRALDIWLQATAQINPVPAAL
jgi:hypothetical protein